MVSFEEMFNMLKDMRDTINEMGGVEMLFDMIDSYNSAGIADGNISGMEYE